VDAKNPLTTDSVMSGASLTKVAFVYMVMQLVQKVCLDLDKPIYQYLPKPLPDYSRYSDLAGDERYKKITSRMLLDHTSGFPNWRILKTTANYTFILCQVRGMHIRVKESLLLQLVRGRGDAQGIGRIDGTRVFWSLGMTRTNMKWSLKFEANHAKDLTNKGNPLGPQRRLRADAAGSMLTTPSGFFEVCGGDVAGTRVEA